MKSSTEQLSAKQPAFDLPLFDWQVAVVRPSAGTRGGLYVARKYGVNPALADLVAALAGIGNEAR
jgi:hypothetical protein